jgi:hypothetical protein
MASGSRSQVRVLTSRSVKRNVGGAVGAASGAVTTRNFAPLDGECKHVTGDVQRSSVLGLSETGLELADHSHALAPFDDVRLKLI